jgi:hypothetical protein
MQGDVRAGLIDITTTAPPPPLVQPPTFVFPDFEFILLISVKQEPQLGVGRDEATPLR